MPGWIVGLSGQGGENREISFPDVVISHSNPACLTLIGRNRQITNNWPWRQSLRLTYGHPSNVFINVWVPKNIEKHYISRNIRTGARDLFENSNRIKLSSNFPHQLLTFRQSPKSDFYYHKIIGNPNFQLRVCCPPTTSDDRSCTPPLPWTGSQVTQPRHLPWLTNAEDHLHFSVSLNSQWIKTETLPCFKPVLRLPLLAPEISQTSWI